MKRYRLSLILLSFLVITSVIGLLSVKGLAQTDLNYTFQNDNVYESPYSVYEDDFNVRNKTILTITDLFPATYSFTGETGLTDTSISFIDSETSFDGGSEVIATLGGHSEILQFQDDITGGEDPTFKHDMTQSTSGEMEWFLRTSDSTKFFYIVIGEVAGHVERFRFDSGNIEYTNGGGWQTLQAFSNDQWYHIRFVWRADDTWDFYIEGELVLDDIALEVNQVVGIEFFEITGLGDSTDYVYFDAWGEDWDVNYTINDNLYAFNTTITNTTKEVDKWEYAYSDFPTQYAVGSDVFSDWSEDDTLDKINIARDFNSLDGNPSYFPDKTIKIHDHIGSGADIGIEREFNIIDGITNVSWSLNFTALDALSQSEITLEIYSFDDTLISQVYLEFGDVCYKDGGGSEVILETGIITTGEIYDFNLYSISNHNVMVLRFSIDGVFYDSYAIPSLDSTKKGLGKIKFKNYHDPPRELIVYLDNIGVYSNGTSLSTEVAFRQVDLDSDLFHQNWWFQEHSLLYLNLTGNIGVHLTDWYFYLGITGVEEVVARREFYGMGETFNIYEQTYDSQVYIFTPKIWLEFYDQISNYSEIRINGVILTDGTNDYTLDFTSQNVKINESFFYVDSNNRLRGQCFYNDSNLEYIQANFDIVNVPNENRSLKVKSQFSGQFGYFSLSYIDLTSSTIELGTGADSHNIILPQEKAMDEFVFLITDNDNLEAGYGSGYIYGIQLIWNPSISITIVTISLIMVIIPIIIMIVPTLTLYSRYGKSVIMPVFIFMAIICFAGGLIPAWLFFILMIGAGGFLVLKKGSDE